MPQLSEQRRDLAPMMRLMIEHVHDPESLGHRASRAVFVVRVSRGGVQPLERHAFGPLQELRVDDAAMPAKLIEALVKIAIALDEGGILREAGQEHQIAGQDVIERGMDRTKYACMSFLRSASERVAQSAYIFAFIHELYSAMTAQ